MKHLKQFEKINFDEWEFEDDADNTFNIGDLFFWEVNKKDQLEYNGNNKLIKKIIYDCNNSQPHMTNKFYISYDGWMPYTNGYSYFQNNKYIYKGKFADWLKNAK